MPDAAVSASIPPTRQTRCQAGCVAWSMRKQSSNAMVSECNPRLLIVADDRLKTVPTLVNYTQSRNLLFVCFPFPFQFFSLISSFCPFPPFTALPTAQKLIPCTALGMEHLLRWTST